MPPASSSQEVIGSTESVSATSSVNSTESVSRTTSATQISPPTPNTTTVDCADYSLEYDASYYGYSSSTSYEASIHDCLAACSAQSDWVAIHYSSNDCLFFVYFDVDSKNEGALGLTFAIKTRIVPSTTSSIISPTPTANAYDVIISGSLQPFCTSLLGITIPTTTLISTITSTEALGVIELTTETITSTSTGYLEAATFYTSTAYVVISTRMPTRPEVVRRDDGPQTSVSSSQPSETATPGALATYEASLITSACSKAASAPDPTTVSVLTTVTSVAVTTDIQTTTSTWLVIEDAVSTVYAGTTVTIFTAVDAYDIITSDGLQDYCTSYLGFTADTTTVDETYSTRTVIPTLTDLATETITLTESATVEVTQYHTAFTTYAIPGARIKRRTA